VIINNPNHRGSRPVAVLAVLRADAQLGVSGMLSVTVVDGIERDRW
jgi:hypothetical protein